MSRTIISRKLRDAVKVHDSPAYTLAIRCGLPVSSVYHYLNGIHAVRPDDPRWARLGRIVGVDEDSLFTVQQTGGDL